MSDDDGEDVLAELEGELSGFVPGTFGELLGFSYDPDDYERHSWSRGLRNARHGPCAQIAGSVRLVTGVTTSFCARYAELQSYRIARPAQPHSWVEEVGRTEC